ncbi:MAG: apolipoprotein N-acyltransferase [Alphaproteobacteria bacterium PA4]|nr:MAG: apolipoprotein N-acyltransferase [Alphaproteobacteria bacterium PA4]
MTLPVSLLLSLVAGAAAALGFEPWGLWPLTVLGIGVLFALVDAAPGRRTAAWLGWAWGVGHFTTGLTWIATAFTFQAKMPAALGWVAVVGLAMFLALYVALAAALARALPWSSTSRALGFGASWMLAEWLRGVLLSGFAWNPLGAAWLNVPGLPLLAEFIGALGLSGLMVIAGAALWLIAQPAVALTQRLAAGGMMLALLMGAVIGNGQDGETFFADNPAVLVVQPDIGQDVKYVPGAEAAHLQAYIDLTRAGLAEAGDDGSAEAPNGNLSSDGATAPDALPANAGRPVEEAPILDSMGGATDAVKAAGVDSDFGDRVESASTLVVWSESAVFGLVEEDAALRRQLASALRPRDLLLFGGVAAVRDAAGNVTELTNSLFVLDARARIVGRYDKAHLVPLGEYVPARTLMTALGLARLAPGDLDFRPGPGPRTLALPGAPAVAPMICYEIIFPHAVINQRQRPAWIANISNDAWFGPSGPPQHLAQARLRAIEEGLPIVRATPTGISAIIDAHGNVVASQPAGGRGTIGATLPPPLPQTLFGIYGHQTSAVLGLLLLLIGLTTGTGRDGRRDQRRI